MYDDCVLLSMRFPQKLWRIVNDCKSGAIRWSLNGGTILLDYKKFQDEYLTSPNSIFKTKNITSFIRQLNLYGFRKVTSHNRDPMCNSHNPDVHEFLQENFRSSRNDLLIKVCRRTGAAAAAAAATAAAAAGGKIKFFERTRNNNNNNNNNNGKNTMKRKISLGRKETQATVMMSRLQIYRLALTEALKEATRDYNRERFWEEAINDDPLAEIVNSNEPDGVEVWISSYKFGINRAVKVPDTKIKFNFS